MSSQEPNSAGAIPIYEPNLVFFSDIKAERIKWLWEGRIPLEMLSLLIGYEGDGKSMFAAYMMAQVSTGLPWGDDRDKLREAGSVLYLTTEDDPNKVTKPRLIAAGADFTKIAMIGGFRVGDVERPLSNLTEQKEVLRKAVARMDDLRLIVIDPISAYMEGKNENRNSDVREYLNPLVNIAKEREAAVVGITHLNKNEEASSLSRVLGSRAFTATPRAIWLVRQDVKQPERVLVVKHKWNLGKCAKGLAFRIEDVPITMDDGTQDMRGRCNIEDEPVVMTAEELLRASAESGRPRKQETASEWLENYLSDGEKDALDVIRDGEAANFSQRTLERAKKRAGVQSIVERDPDTGQVIGSLWSLKPDEWKDL